MGCAMIGREGNGETALANTLELLTKAYSSGIRYFDTAAAYGNSEVLLGHFMNQIERTSVFIATKAPFPYKEKGAHAAFEVFKRTFYESFERLRTDYIDLYHIHDTESYAVGVEQVLPFLEERKKEGMIGAIGLGTRSLVAHEQAMLDGIIDASLCYFEYNLLSTAAKRILPCAKEQGVAFINASTLMPGFLVSYSGERVELSEERESYINKQVLKRHRLIQGMKKLCGEMGIDILAAAMQYGLFQPDIDLTLVGISKLKELQSAESLLSAAIYPEQWAALTRLQESHRFVHVQDEYAIYPFITKE
ncbi:Predicted oxidoreductase [Paenibacillus sp. UNCCL117]|nr:Predicted oxidoreductase [Paenibacillus sp. cl123]SFW11380.1 Predicted oxidoreductase [Paenibacillus sp. UNCCL117]